MRKILLLVTAIVILVVLGGTTPVMTDDGGLRGVGPRAVVANLRGFDEVPALSTTGQGRFIATLNAAGTELTFQLNYSNLVGNVAQAHIHFGQLGVNGGIMLFLCTNLGNGPAGTQACPGTNSGGVNGNLTAAEIVSSASAQGIALGEFSEVLRAIRAGIAYANVHSDLYPGGEIRGQLIFIPE